MKKSFKKTVRIVAAALCLTTMLGIFAACTEPDTPGQTYDNLVKLTIDAGGQNAQYNTTASMDYDKFLNPYPYNTLEKLVDAWNEGEQNLRFALGKARAEKMKKAFDTESRIFPVEHVKAASAAMETENPMEAEKLLNLYRLQRLEALRPTDSFSEEYVFYYGLKLKLLLRIRQFDTAIGEKAYKSIYNAILNGDRLEAIQ